MKVDLNRMCSFQ